MTFFFPAARTSMMVAAANGISGRVRPSASRNGDGNPVSAAPAIRFVATPEYATISNPAVALPSMTSVSVNVVTKQSGGAKPRSGSSVAASGWEAMAQPASGTSTAGALASDATV